MTRITVAVVDVDPFVRKALRDMLSRDEDIEVLGEGSDGNDAVSASRTLSPDVLVMDVRMPHLDGIEATRRLNDLGLTTRVLMLALSATDDDVLAAVEAGASGFVLKEDPPEIILTAVKAIAAGGTVFAPAALVKLLRGRSHSRYLPRQTRMALDTLTGREREVLCHLGTGLSNSEIAALLGVSDDTVKTHISHVLAKLRMNRVQAAVLVHKAGLLES